MNLSISTVLVRLLVVTLAAPVTLAHAAGDTPASLSPVPGLRASIDRAATAAAGPLPSSAPAYGPIQALLRRDRSRKQVSSGGGKTGMVMGIVGMVAGLAATYYMVKMVQDSEDELTAATSGQ